MEYLKKVPSGVIAAGSIGCIIAFLMHICMLIWSETPKAYAGNIKVLVLTDAAGLGDKGFNDVCWQGVQRAVKDFGVEAQFLQSREQADYIPNITLAAERADVVVTLGFLFVDAVKEFAPNFPRTRFLHMEGDISVDNVASFDFKSEEGGFLAGVIAGLFTKNRKAGVVSGMDIPPVEAYVSGFRAGMKTAQSKRQEPLEAIVASAGSFNDPVKGKSLAQALMRKGVDVIFRAAGNTGVGVLEAVKHTDGVFLITEDLDMDAEMPGKILASTLKRMDLVIYNTIREIIQGGFQPRHRWLGAAEGAVSLSEMQYSKQLFKPEDLETIRKAHDLLRENRITVPKRYSDVDAFEPPAGL